MPQQYRFFIKTQSPQGPVVRSEQTHLPDPVATRPPPLDRHREQVLQTGQLPNHRCVSHAAISTLNLVALDHKRVDLIQPLRYEKLAERLQCKPHLPALRAL